jgi:hypothetical protein
MDQKNTGAYCMIDTYISAETEAILASFIAVLPASAPRTPICPGVAATPASTDLSGNAVPERSAIGDPNLFYSLIRTDSVPILLKGITAVDADLGKQIVGVFE